MTDKPHVAHIRRDLLARLNIAVGSLSLVEKNLLYAITVLTPMKENVINEFNEGVEGFLPGEKQPPISDEVPWKIYGVDDV